MNIMGLKPGESSETRETPERTETQKLDDATLDPLAYIEQSGNYERSESIQVGLEDVIANVARSAELNRENRVSVAWDGSSKNETQPLEGDMQVTPRVTWKTQSDAMQETSQTEQTSGGGDFSGNTIPDAIGMKQPEQGDLPMPLPQTTGVTSQIEPALPVVRAEKLTETNRAEENLDSVGDDAQLADIDLQNVLEKQQQLVQMLSQISKDLSDTAMSTIRNMKE